jgi:CRISPR-associated protein Cmr1
VHHFRNGYLRNALQAGKNFKISLCFRPTAQAQDIENLAQALQLLGLLGGLGSRARKGLGSIAIHNISGTENVHIPKNTNEYQEIIQTICQTQPAEMPPFSALSQKSRVDISLKGKDAWQLLEQVGREMLLYRSYGRMNPRSGQHAVLGGQKSEQNFSSDHDIAYQVAQGQTVTTHPERVVFGLPHNYFFSSLKAQVDVNPVHQQEGAWKSDGRGRRASPLFIHMHQFPDGQCAAIQTLMPATFLPPSDRIELKGKARSAATCQITPAIDWNIIHQFLNRFQNRQEIYHP